MAEAIDRLTLSRDVARAEERIARGAADPFLDVRHVAQQSTYRALLESEPPAHEVLVRDALLRWVHELLQVRIGLDLASDEREAIEHVDERFVRDPPATFAGARRALVTAPTPALAEAALDRVAALAPPIGAVRKERRARRFEAARRLGLAHPFALATTAQVSALESAARGLLDATEGIAADLRRHARITTPAQAMHHAFARDAQEGWPARLVPRWLEEVFAAICPRPFRPPALPEALGGASFLRAAAAWGRALRLAGTARSLPFVLARDPYPVDAHRFGDLLALAVADPIFQKKKLGVSARVASAQSRSLRTSLLAAARETAVRFLLAATESVDAGAFEELTARAFGAPIPGALRDAWPEPRADEPARLVALLAVHAFEADLRSRFDEDWFQNPKTASHLAAIASGPVFAGDPPDETTPAAIGRAFERALG